MIEDDANILDHRQHHLAKALGLGFGTCGEVQMIQFADAVNNSRYLLAELLGQVGEVNLRVFDDVVQDCGGNGFAIQAHAGQDLRHGDGMLNVGLAALALLATVGHGAILIGLRHHLDLLPGHVALERFDQLRQTLVRAQ